MRRIVTARLVLEPLVVEHAPAMFEILRDPELYRFLDYGPAPDVEHLQRVYAQLATRASPDGREQWLNWIVFRDDAPIGFVQATIDPVRSAEIAYVFARAQWGNGYAREATAAMIDELRDTYAVVRLTATVDEGNARSITLLERVGCDVILKTKKGGPAGPPREPTAES